MVSICFQDEAINRIFAELLETRGVKAEIVKDLSVLESDTRIITEPIFLPKLDQKHLTHCLVIHYRDSQIPPPALSLSQPLTEQKIETALAKLLAVE